MRRLIAALALVVAAIPAATSPAAAGGSRPPGHVLPASVTAPAVSVELDRTAVHARLGQRFSFESTVTNRGDVPVSGLIAHLNILTTDPTVYVDPEDWSPQRTQYLDELPADGSARLKWNVQAVNSGPLILYVAVAKPGTPAVTVSDQLALAVSQRRTINAGGILPLAMGVPALVLALMVLATRRRRRLR